MESAGSSASPLHRAAAEVEAHVAASGWDRPPALFALVRAADLARDEPEAAIRLGLDASDPDALTPVEQESLPAGELDEALARIAWPAAVAGCALTQEIVVLPPSVAEELGNRLDGPGGAELAATHPDRREARLAVAVTRGGGRAAVLRLRAADGGTDDLVTAPDLAPNLARALLETLGEGPGEPADPADPA